MPPPILALLAIWSSSTAILNRPAPAPTWTDQTFDGVVTWSLPIKVKTFDVKMAGPADSKTDFWNGQDDDCQYVVSVTTVAKTMSSRNARECLAGFVNSVLRNKQITLDGEKDLLVQGWPGLAFTVISKNGTTSVLRAYVGQDSLVTLVCTYATDPVRPPEVDRAQNSIKFAKSGEQTKVGPALERLPLGDSGMTALFPLPPKGDQNEIGIGANRGVLTMYTSNYLGRAYILAYRDAPNLPEDPPEAMIQDVFDSFQREMLDAIDGKATKTRDYTIGKDLGRRADFTAPHDRSGSLVEYLHGKRVIILVVAGPRVYRDPETIEAFLHSVEFKS